MKPRSRVQDIPDWLLERLARGELGAADAERIRALARAEGGQEQLDAQLALLEQSNRQILAQHPPAEVAGEIRRRLARAERSSAGQQRSAARARWLLGALATGGVALAALLLVVRPGTDPGGALPGTPGGLPLPGEPPEITTIKGMRPQLAIYRKQGDRADRLGPGSSVRPGDTLQLAYVSANSRYGVVASVDARGTVTLHLPESDGPAARLAGPGERPLPHAYQLDATPGFERFVLVTSEEPFTTATVREALLGPGKPLPASLTLTEHTLSKETP